MEDALFWALSHDGVFAALLRWLAAAQLVESCSSLTEEAPDAQTSAFAETILALSPAGFAEYFYARISYEAAKAFKAAEDAPIVDNIAACSSSATAEAPRGNAGPQKSGRQQRSTSSTQLSGLQEVSSAMQGSPGLVDNENFPSLGSSSSTKKATKVTPPLHS